MKKFVKVIAFVMALVTLTCVLASCGGLSGKYGATVAGTGTEYEFKGNKVYITYKILTAKLDPIEGKYSIDGDKIKFEFSTEGIENGIAKGFIEELNKIEHSFEKGDDYIKIDGVKYTKVED